jgi:hypothetical protein
VRTLTFERITKEQVMASIENMRRIVCLANSRKPDGRCVAGKLYAQGKFGAWLRPISIREGEELSEQERHITSREGSFLPRNTTLMRKE